MVCGNYNKTYPVFFCCFFFSLSMQPFEHPLCTKDGIIFDLLWVYKSHTCQYLTKRDYIIWICIINVYTLKIIKINDLFFVPISGTLYHISRSMAKIQSQERYVMWNLYFGSVIREMFWLSSKTQIKGSWTVQLCSRSCDKWYCCQGVCLMVMAWWILQLFKRNFIIALESYDLTEKILYVLWLVSKDRRSLQTLHLYLHREAWLYLSTLGLFSCSSWQPLQAKELIKLNFHKNTEGKAAEKHIFFLFPLLHFFYIYLVFFNMVSSLIS